MIIRKAFVGIVIIISCIIMYNRGIDLDWFLQKGKETYKATKDIYETTKDVATKVKAVASPLVKAAIQIQQPAIINNPYKNTVAHVRLGNELNADEKAYRSIRKPKVRSALERILNRSLEEKYIPTIAFVCSGGGYRAMLCTLGSLCGASKLGLLDATTYISALSGSTWAVGSWFATGMSIIDCRSYIGQCISKTLQDVTKQELQRMIDTFLVKIAYDQPFTLVDLYGVLLGNRLLAQMNVDTFMTYLSSQSERVATGDWPYPIYTAVDGREEVAAHPSWYEFTPHEIGSATFASYIPTWSYGRTFINGQSTDDAPEQNLAYHFGTWGSAFAAHAGLIWEELTQDINDPIVKPFFETMFIEPIHGKRPLPFWSEVHNYMFSMKNQTLKDSQILKLVDGGLAFNLPYPPVSGIRSERKADIIIFLDASAGTFLNEFRKVENYARKHNMPFPKIDYAGLDKKTITVFKDENDKSVPVVIYMPRITDMQLWQENASKSEFDTFALEGFDLDHCTAKSFCDTSNFHYSLDQSKKVMDTTEFNMIVNKDIIFEAINWVIDTK